MLERLTVENFKCFGSFKVDFRADTVLVGPNNAGKSTIVSALRAGGAVLRMAALRRPPATRMIDGENLGVFPLRDFRLPLELENVRHEFHVEKVTQVRLEFAQDLRVTIRWQPGDDSDMGVSYIEVGAGGQPASTAIAKRILGRQTMSVLPGLRPVDMHEALLKVETVTRNLGGRLASQHFRNELLLLKRERRLRGYREYVRRWLPEFQLDDVEMDSSASQVNVFYRESNHSRELCWAGDGVQVFLQILLHLYRSPEAKTIVLDEPEVFLHADLQQRILGVLAERGSQNIIATHSSEIIGAVQPDALAWVDKSRKASVRLPRDSDAGPMMEALGSVFNLGLARLLRTKAALFVEGRDVKILRQLAATLGMPALDAQPDFTVVPLEGSSNWRKLEAFDWVATNFLKGSVRGLAVFDRDMHSQGAIDDLAVGLKAAGVDCHVWARHELENYLLVPSAIARLTDATEEEVDRLLKEVASSMRDDAIELTAAALTEEGAVRGLNIKSVLSLARAEVATYWSNPETRLLRLPGKELLKGLNRELSAQGAKPIRILQLAREMESEEIDPEIGRVLRRALPVGH